METSNLLFVDDEWCRPQERVVLESAFGELQRRRPAYRFLFETAALSPGRYDVEPVLTHLERNPTIVAVVLDIMFGSPSSPLGLDILRAIRERSPLLPVFILSSVDRDLEVLERAMEYGATEYLVKTANARDLERLLRIYVEENAGEADFAIWGNSSPVRHMRAVTARVAITQPARVLLVGESGSGKELVARALHRQGRRRNRPFVDKNCAYASTELLDSDLFGHERGAFTGAHDRHIGRLEAANGGTLFLDEISSMPHESQGKLLRVLETGQFQRLGGNETITSDFQLICATNQEPDELVASGRLRSDLYYRISEFTITVPPLRERAGDVAILAELFLNRIRARHEAPGPPGGHFDAAALRALERYEWPGNVRQLRNVVSSAVTLSRLEQMGLETLPESIANHPPANTTLAAPSPSSDGPAGATTRELLWWKRRIRDELTLALELKKQISAYKGRQWKAEFMRILYPESKAQSAKGFNDLIRRLTTGPWGSTEVATDPELSQLLQQLLD